MSIILSVQDLKVEAANKVILNGVNLEIGEGEVHAIMGPNGSGKSTFANALMGNPTIKILNGTVSFKGKDVIKLSVDERAKKGLFLAFQYPVEIDGVSFINFLRQAYNSIYGGTEKQLGVKAFRKLVQEKMALLDMKPDFLERHVNLGFSGGEKKKAEILQLAVLQPKLAILDEIDSGLDIDALKTVSKGINSIKEVVPGMSLLIITHYQRILKYIDPAFVHVMQDGAITKSGGRVLAEELESKGYGGHCV